MGIWSCLCALLVVWTCLSCTTVCSQLSTLDRLQPAAVAGSDGIDFRRLRRSRSPRHDATGPFLRVGTAPPPTDTVSMFDSVVIRCEFQGSPPPSVDWLRDGVVIRKAGLAESVEEQTNSLDTLLTKPPEALVSTSARLYLDCMTPADQGVYTCQGQTAYQTKSVSTRLFVDESASEDGVDICERVKNVHLRPARIVQWRRHVLAKMGGRIRLICETTGFPAPVVTWYKGDRLVTGDRHRITVMSNGDLLIDPLKWADMGQYRCKASNEFTSDEITTFLYPFKA